MLLKCSALLRLLGPAVESTAMAYYRTSGVQAPAYLCSQHLEQVCKSYHVSSRTLQQQQQSSTTGEQAASSTSTSQTEDNHQSTSSSSSSETGSGPDSQQQQNPEDLRQKIFSGFRSGFDQFKSRMGAGAGSGTGPDSSAGSEEAQQEDAGTRAKRLMRTIAKEVAEAVLPREEHRSATRAFEGELYKASEYTGPTAMAVMKKKETAWERTMKSLQEKMGDNPVFQRLMKVNVSGSAPVKKAGEIAEDLKEKWENSDHPLVHKVEDVKARLFDPSEQARAMQEIRARDTAFDMSRFIRSVRADAPVVVKAFLTHDLETLSKHCGPELMERFEGIFKHFASQGLFEDPSILFTSDVTFVEVKMVEDDPLVIVQFNCHQLKCTRDKFGNVVEGSPDSIQRVYYFWGLQQEKQGVVAADGTVVPPRWVLKDMMWQSMLALV